MFEIDFNKPIHVYFIGIGGISMSGLAEILLSEGFRVSGSDMKASPLTESLAQKGATIFIGQRYENLTSDIDLVVYTAAIKESNPEMQAVKALNIPALTRAELLGQLMRNYKLPIAISGTHGKTTTTSMVSEILMKADTNPTLSIGGILKSISGNFRIGGSDYFVTEACEYTNSFLSFFPKISIVLNIEEDHLDFFKDLNDIRDSFHNFMKLLPEDGILIINGDIENLSELISDLSCKIVTFGTKADCDYQAENIVYNELGCAGFDVVSNSAITTHIELGVPGIHNVLNALSAIALSDVLSVERSIVVSALREFHGTDRRFEYKGDVNGFTIIDDYAHHPTEIAATLNACKNYPHKTIWCIFQPHTYTRTKAFMKEFAQALSLADKVILADIYAARETDTLGISSETLQAEIKALGKDCYYFSTFEEIESFALKNCTKGDLLITMGAGDVVKIGENLLSK